MLLKRNSSEVQARLLLEVAVDLFPTELGRGLLSQTEGPAISVSGNPRATRCQGRGPTCSLLQRLPTEDVGTVNRKWAIKYTRVLGSGFYGL